MRTYRVALLRALGPGREINTASLFGMINYAELSVYGGSHDQTLTPWWVGLKVS